MFGTVKLVIIGLAALAIVGAISGYFMYQSNLISNLNETIESKSEQIKVLEIDKQQLEASNISLDTELQQKTKETLEAYAEAERLRELDMTAQKRIANVERQLTNRENVSRHEAVRKGRRASLLVRLINKAIECEIDNFNKIGGTCIRGKWVEDPE